MNERYVFYRFQKILLATNMLYYGTMESTSLINFMKIFLTYYNTYIDDIIEIIIDFQYTLNKLRILI